MRWGEAKKPPPSQLRPNSRPPAPKPNARTAAPTTSSNFFLIQHAPYVEPAQTRHPTYKTGARGKQVASPKSPLRGGRAGREIEPGGAEGVREGQFAEAGCRSVDDDVAGKNRLPAVSVRHLRRKRERCVELSDSPFHPPIRVDKHPLRGAQLFEPIRRAAT